MQVQLILRTLIQLHIFVICSGSYNSGLPAFLVNFWDDFVYSQHDRSSNGWPQCKSSFSFHYFICLLQMIWQLPFCQVEKAGVIQSLLFVSGLNTLFQSLFGTRLPTVISASYTFVAPTISIVIASRYRKYLNPQEVIFHTSTCFWFLVQLNLFIIIILFFFLFARVCVLGEGALGEGGGGLGGVWGRREDGWGHVAHQCFFLTLCVLHDLSEICTYYERNTGQPNYGFSFSDSNRFHGILENCC